MNQIGKIPQSLPGRPKAALGQSSGGRYNKRVEVSIGVNPGNNRSW